MRKFLILTFAMINIITLSFAQNKISFNVKQANKKFDVFNYSEAIAKYKRSLNKNKADSTYIIQKIADSYRMLNDPQNAEVWYAKILNKGTEDKNLLWYADALKQNMKYADAENFYKQYLVQHPSDQYTQNVLDGLKKVSKLSQDQGYYELSLVGFNSTYSDFGPAYIGDSLFFTSNRPNKYGSLKDNWSSHDYYQIYNAKNKGNGVFNTSILRKNIKYHDGPVAYDAINKQLIFTRTNYSSSLVKASDNKTAVLKLYAVTFPFTSNKAKAEPLSINSDEFSNAHPTITRDGSTLYFASDRPGGFGGTDIYYCTRVGSSWSAPINVGPVVNSMYDEKFPFIGDDGNLFFASNAIGGLGGLDIYYSINKNGTWKAPVNMGAPINTSKDDFGLISNQNEKSGFLTSNRNGGIGDDDIYFFTWKEVKQYMTINVIDAVTKNAIPFASVQCNCMNNKSYIADNLGQVKIEYNPTNNKCNIQATSNGYSANSIIAIIENPTNPVIVPLSKNTKLVVVVREEATNLPIRDINIKFTDPISNLVITKRTDLNGVIEMPFQNTSGIQISSNDFVKEIVGSIAPTEQANNDGSYLREYLVPLKNRMVNVPFSANCFEIGSVVKITNTITNESILATVDENKMLNVDLKPNTTYNVEFENKNEILTTSNLIPGQEVKLNCKFVVGETWILNNIYYDLDKSFIRPDAAIELDKLVQIMKDNPSLQIELSSHTDCRSLATYNTDLSSRRAKSAKTYVVSKGIKETRIISMGYGESHLVNDCACEPTNESSCTDQQHQNNRRTEVKVTKY